MVGDRCHIFVQLDRLWINGLTSVWVFLHALLFSAQPTQKYTRYSYYQILGDQIIARCSLTNGVKSQWHFPNENGGYIALPHQFFPFFFGVSPTIYCMSSMEYELYGYFLGCKMYFGAWSISRIDDCQQQCIIEDVNTRLPGQQGILQDILWQPRIRCATHWTHLLCYLFWWVVFCLFSTNILSLPHAILVRRGTELRGVFKCVCMSPVCSDVDIPPLVIILCFLYQPLLHYLKK